MVTGQTGDHCVAVGTVAQVLSSDGKWLYRWLETLMETLNASKMTLVEKCSFTAVLERYRGIYKSMCICTFHISFFQHKSTFFSPSDTKCCMSDQ